MLIHYIQHTTHTQTKTSNLHKLKTRGDPTYTSRFTYRTGVSVKRRFSHEATSACAAASVTFIDVDVRVGDGLNDWPALVHDVCNILFPKHPLTGNHP